jgi:hypothetical protein
MDWLEWIVAGLTKNAAAVTAGATVVIMIASVVNAWMVIETRRLRKAQTAPHLSLFFEWHVKYTALTHLILRNDGFRQARYIRFRVDPDMWLAKDRKFSETTFMKGLPSLQANESKYLLMNRSIWDELEQMSPDIKIPASTTVWVNYEDVEGNRYHEKFELNLKAIRQREPSGMPPSRTDSMAGSLDSIANSLTTIVKKMPDKKGFL